MTRYVSTRGGAAPTGFREALLGGLAPDGGLYLPEAWPRLAPETVAALDAADFPAIAADVLAPLAAPWIDRATLENEARLAFKSFAAPSVVAPLHRLSADLFVLELFHGPTLAFKDVAMQLLARLFARALAETGETITLIAATSGDTGGAAVAAFAATPRIRLVVLYPDGRISDVQRRFMTTSGADTVEAYAVAGTFDDCQAMVKTLFADRDFAAATKLSGVNSINWARLAIQTAYYFSAAAALRATGEARPPVFSVPTGNFGDAFAGHVATRLGLAAGPLLVAVNENDILARVVETGVYAPRGAVATDSPSMDIEVASNFERMLFEAAAGDGDRVDRLMADLRTNGRFALPDDMLAFVRRALRVRRVDGAARADIMRRWHAIGYSLDPHSAVAVGAAEAALASGEAAAPVVALATAHPAKFPDAVEAATGARPRLSPEADARLSRGERFRRIAADAGRLKAAILAR